jgi:ABC-type glycerol-3-phosphate transport system substrate-binding protein
MKRIILALVLPLLVVAFCWAGGQQEATGEGAAEKKQEKKRIVHYHWTETVYDKINNQAVEMFEKEHPNVEVKLLLFADADRATKIRTALTSEGEIDSFALANMESPEFHAAGMMQPIMPEGFGKDSVQEVVDMWQPGSIKVCGGVWDGEYYGIPFELSNYVGWINKTHMKEAGLDPQNDIPETWEEFASATKKMTKDEGGVRVRNGFATNAKAYVFPFLILHAFMHQQGLDWSTEEGFLKSLESPKSVTAMRTFTNLATKHDVWDPGLFDNDREGFGNGLTSTFLTGGSWYWGVLDQYSVEREEVTPFPYPRYENGKDIGGVGYGYCLYVSKLAEDPVLTWEWLDTMASQPNEFIKQGYHQPRKTLDQDLAREYIPGWDTVFADELKKTSPILASTKMAEVQDAVGAAMARIIFEDMDVEKSMQMLKDDANSILQ